MSIARFWTVVGPASWDPVLRAAAAAPGRTLLQNARLFALAEMAAADAYIAVFDAKYTYNFWRPITAIRNGDTHGNGGTMRVPDWEPLVDTPLHPEYPCAHCITSAAVAAVLEAELGPTFPEITMTSPTAAGVVRRWTSAKAFNRRGLRRAHLRRHPLRHVGGRGADDGPADRRVRRRAVPQANSLKSQRRDQSPPAR